MYIYIFFKQVPTTSASATSASATSASATSASATSASMSLKRTWKRT